MGAIRNLIFSITLGNLNLLFSLVSLVRGEHEVRRPMGRLFMSDVFEWIWKELAVAQSCQDRGIYLEGLPG